LDEDRPRPIRIRIAIAAVVCEHLQYLHRRLGRLPYEWKRVGATMETESETITGQNSGQNSAADFVRTQNRLSGGARISHHRLLVYGPIGRRGAALIGSHLKQNCGTLRK
jgi:hypothetical protein